MTDRERAQAYLELAIKADGEEVTWSELERASVVEGPWLAKRLLEALDEIEQLRKVCEVADEILSCDMQESTWLIMRPLARALDESGWYGKSATEEAVNERG
jgi:hypothetical protein